MHRIEQQVYQNKHFVKGKRVDELAPLIAKMRNSRYFAGTDYSSFESSFRPELTDVCECEMWRFFLKNEPDRLADVMRAYYQVRMKKINGRMTEVYVPRVEVMRNRRFVAKVVGSRMSGEMWTSLANGFTNLMVMLFLLSEKGVDWEHVEGFVEGDDGLFGLNTKCLSDDDYSTLGFNIKLEYTQDLRETSFCGNIFDPEDCRVLVDPRNAVRLFYTCANTYLHSKQSRLLSLMKSKAMSLYCTGKYSPICSKLALKVMQLLSDVVARKDGMNPWWSAEVEWLYKSETFRPVTISDSARLIYESKFGIPVSQQLEIEKRIDETKDINSFDLPFYLCNKSFDEGLLLGSSAGSFD